MFPTTRANGPPPPPTPLPSPDELSPVHATIRRLSDRLVELQRPIRILNAIKWDDAVETRFFEQKERELPDVPQGYYDDRPLGFDVGALRREFYSFERDLRRELGTFNACGDLMLRASKEYRVVLDLLELRGTPDFSAISQGLFGSTLDRFHAGEPTLGDLADAVTRTLDRLTDTGPLSEDEPDHDSAAAVEFLSERMTSYFGPGAVDVRLSDGVVADAAAGSNYIKIREGAVFTRRDLEVLTVHEGWIHVGTTLNGLAQPIATFLGKGTPSCTVTQEGLAVLQEIFCMCSSPKRVRKLADRVHAVRMAEEGADFLEVYRGLLERGASRNGAYQTTYRAFRGALPTGTGPFTKDVSYTRGFVQLFNFVRLAIREGQVDRIPLLFVGKLRLGDIGTLAQLVDDGIVQPAHYLPPPYDDLRGLTAWMCYSNFLSTFDLDEAARDYQAILRPRSGDV